MVATKCDEGKQSSIGGQGQEIFNTFTFGDATIVREI